MYVPTLAKWKEVREVCLQLHDLPTWVRAVWALSYEEFCRLLSYDRPENLSIAIECDYITQSYLDFLELQIELEPRGPDWTQILRNRLVSSRPYVGQKSLSVSINRPSDSFYLMTIHAPCRALYWEIDSVNPEEPDQFWGLGSVETEN